MTATIEAISVLALKPPDCGFPAGKLKLAVILVKQSNTQVTMELHTCTNGGYEVTYPLLCGLGTKLMENLSAFKND